jgi:glycosyltransferase involved in cell wall biosynthesis
MAEALRQTNGVDTLSLLANRGVYRSLEEHLPQVLRMLPLCHLPGPESLVRRLSIASGLVALDHWTGSIDWIYCPKEQPVAVRRARLAVTVHDVLSFEPATNWGNGRTSLRTRLMWRFVMSRLLKRAHLIAAVSHFTRDRLVELFGSSLAERIVVIGNGVDPIFFAPASADDASVLNRYGVSEGGYLLAVGGLNRRKGGDVLLGIGARLGRAGADLQILVCGASHDVDLFQRLANHQREDPTFPLRLAGYVADRDLAALYRHSKALLFPSRYEGFGIPLAEAMAAGTPVICSNIPALVETAGGVAVTVAAWNPDDWVDAITQLCHCGSACNELIRRGRHRAAELTWDSCGRRLADAMKRM